MVKRDRVIQTRDDALLQLLVESVWRALFSSVLLTWRINICCTCLPCVCMLLYCVCFNVCIPDKGSMKWEWSRELKKCLASRSWLCAVWIPLVCRLQKKCVSTAMTHFKYHSLYSETVTVVLNLSTQQALIWHTLLLETSLYNRSHLFYMSSVICCFPDYQPCGGSENIPLSLKG